MATVGPQGQFKQADFFDNQAGLNITDSVFAVKTNHALVAYNCDYIATGAVRKRNGHTLLNSSADAQVKSLGFHLYNTSAGAKTVLRASSARLQTVDQTTGACTNKTDDTVSASAAAFSDATIPVVFNQFNTALASVAWATGGGNTLPIGYNGTKWTQNGVPVPTGTISASAGGSGGVFSATGTYYYSVALHKASTGAWSNATCDTSVAVSATTQKVTLTLSSLTSVDSTKYDYLYIYRSTSSGASGFTTGDLVSVTTAVNTASFVDDGTAYASTVSVPRAASTLLDQSVLSSQTYKASCVWKRRLVVASGSTVYLSDLNKPEAWPTGNYITIPSGGDITAVASLSFTQQLSTPNEILVVFKENEVWVINGSSSSDWTLSFNDYCGCPAQPLIVTANGWMYWINYRGIFMWSGEDKPIYVSRPVEADFGGLTNDLDLSKITLGCGTFFRKQNEVCWFLSSITLGEQKLCLKLDVRLTQPLLNQSLDGRLVEGVFLKDSLSTSIYATLACYPTYNEIMYMGDGSGYIYQAFNNLNSDNGTAISFQYRTKPLDMGQISTAKRYHKIIVWALASSSNNLTLKYWVDYKIDQAHTGSVQQQPIAYAVTNGYWDQGSWDVSYWDSNVVTYVPITFNLRDPSTGIEGDALTLEFNQSDANSPLLIAGFSVIYSTVGLRH